MDDMEDAGYERLLKAEADSSVGAGPPGMPALVC